MKFSYYQYGLAAALFAAALLFGLFLESRFPSKQIDVDKTDFTTAATYGLTRSQLYCSKNALFELVYSNYSKEISLFDICKVLENDNYKKNLQALP